MTQKKYTMQIRLLSDALIGTSGGYGAIIDKDSVFDEAGLPFIPGKRVKGILREQADLLEKFKYLKNPVDKLFGKSGFIGSKTDYLSVSSFTIPEYEENKALLLYLIQKGKIARSEVINSFTSLRMITSIDEDGIAKDTSLRTFRILNKGLIFKGDLSFNPDELEDFENIIALTRRIGSIRNRGLGYIQCSIVENVISDIKIQKTEAI